MAVTTTSQEITTIIAVAGFLFSFSTTVASVVRTRRQDIHDARRELRELLERLIAIPREKLEAAEKYGYNSNAFVSFDGLCNQENTMLSRQAAEIGRRLKTKQEQGLFSAKRKIGDRRFGSKYISATDFFSVGNALFLAYNNEEALEFLQFAAEYALNFNDEIAALRLMGQIYFLRGRPEDGRAKYREASQIFGKYPGYDQYTQVRGNIQTQIAWAFSEANSNYIAFAHERLDEAARLADSLPDPGAQICMLPVTQARQQLRQPQAANPVQPFPAPLVPEIARDAETQ